MESIKFGKPEQEGRRTIEKQPSLSPFNKTFDLAPVKADFSTDL
jgi:hypothetical protein